MRLWGKMKSDSGAANTISFMVIMFFIMLMLISFLDVGIYFNVKNEMQAAAENGARNVALYGGTDTKLRSSRNSSRGGSIQDAEQAVENSIRDKFKSGGANDGMVNASKTTVECGPRNSSGGHAGASAGNTVYCDVTYEYLGLAQGFGLFNLYDGGITSVKGTAVSEVTSN